MSKEMGVIGLGIFVVVVPFLGIPEAWKTPLLVVAGLLVALLGFLMRGQVLSQSRGRDAHPEGRPFVENTETEQ